MSPVLGSRSQVFTTSTAAGGGSGASPGGSGVPVLGGRSQVFRVEADGGGGGASPGGVAPSPVLGSRSQVFMVLPDGEIVAVSCSCCSGDSLDDFNRADDSVWGTATPSGYAWVVQNGGTGTSRAISANEGLIIYTASADLSQVMRVDGEAATPWSGWPIRLLMRMKMDSLPSSNWRNRLGFAITSQDGSLEVSSEAQVSSAGVVDHVVSGDATTTNDNGVAVDITDYFYIRAEVEANEIRARIWQDGDAEPATWTTAAVSSSMSVGVSSNFLVFFNRSRNVGASATASDTARIDFIDFTGNCMFDNFDRVEVSGWGDSTPTGYTWTGTAGSELSVSAGQGHLSADVIVGSGLNSTAQADQDGIGPWSGPVTMTSQFTLPAPLVSSTEVALYFHMRDTTSGNSFQCGVFLVDGGCLLKLFSTELADVDIPLPDGVIGQPLLLSWRFTPNGSMTATLTYASIDYVAEQDISTTAAFATDRFRVEFQVTTSDPGADSNEYTADINDISFDDGCMFDNFSREETGTWGLSTPTGTEWTEPFGIPFGVVLTVTGGVGLVEVPYPSGIVLYVPAPSLYAADGHIGLIDFKTAPIPASGRIQLEVSSDDFNLDFLVKVSSDVAQGSVEMYDGSGYISIDKTDWVADTWYTAKWEYRPNTLTRFKVWERSASEPGTWDAEGSAPPALVGTQLQLIPDDSDPVNDPYLFTFDNIRLETCPPEA